jgi:hypothetical protein
MEFFLNVDDTYSTHEFSIDEIMEYTGCASERFTILAIGNCVRSDLLKKIKVKGVTNLYKGHLVYMKFKLFFTFAF